VSFLLDTDTCSAHMRRPTKLAHRFIQYTGRMSISAVTLAELVDFRNIPGLRLEDWLTS
jgi:tRNA(fMet)-specific endonuclease VapC